MLCVNGIMFCFRDVMYIWKHFLWRTSCTLECVIVCVHLLVRVYVPYIRCTLISDLIFTLGETLFCVFTIMCSGWKWSFKKFKKLSFYSFLFVSSAFCFTLLLSVTVSETLKSKLCLLKIFLTLFFLVFDNSVSLMILLHLSPLVWITSLCLPLFFIFPFLNCFSPQTFIVPCSYFKCFKFKKVSL